MCRCCLRWLTVGGGGGLSVGREGLQQGKKANLGWSTGGGRSLAGRKAAVCVEGFGSQGIRGDFTGMLLLGAGGVVGLQVKALAVESGVRIV